MEAAPDLKKSVVSWTAGTLERIPFQMLCDLETEYNTLSFLTYKLVF